jgi:heterodisulfide reductase subunit A-like polyferredoxin
VHDHLSEIAGSKPTKNTITGIYEPSDVRAGSECTANYDAELSVTATVVEANANYVWSCLTFTPSSTEAVTGFLAAAIGFIWSTAPEFNGTELTTVIPAGTAAAPNRTPTTTAAAAAAAAATTTATATATATAAATTTATATATVATSVFASAAATSTTISKDARTPRPENS